MSERVCEVVRHHLWFAGCSGGEVHQRNVVVGVDVVGTYEWGSLVASAGKVVPTVGHVGSDRDDVLQRGALRHCVLDVPDNDVVANGYDGFDVGGVTAVDDVFAGEQVCCRNGYGADFVKCYDGEPELVSTLENEHHHIAFADAQRGEICRSLVALALDVGKCKLDGFACFVGPEQGFLVGVCSCPFVDNVVAEVEIVGNVDVEILHEVLVGVETRLCEKFF